MEPCLLMVKHPTLIIVRFKIESICMLGLDTLLDFDDVKSLVHRRKDLPAGIPIDVCSAPVFVSSCMNSYTNET